MSPQVTAAVIAAIVSGITLIVTSVAQWLSRRGTRRALQEQRKQLDRTLAEQRTRTLNERFATAAGQLGDDKPSAVRLAGVYAMAGLADDWPENRQTCVNVLCAYLRLPYEPDPGKGADASKHLDFRASREVRHAVIRVITEHLRDDSNRSWQGLNLDFTGVAFDGGDFRFAQFTGGMVNFNGATFSGDIVDFSGATFSGDIVDFSGATFSGELSFTLAMFCGGEVRFTRAKLFGGQVNFNGATFSGAEVSFPGAEFSTGLVIFSGAKFTGGEVNFYTATFSGAVVDFTDPAEWKVPPLFLWTGTPPPGVKLPGMPADPPARVSPADRPVSGVPVDGPTDVLPGPRIEPE